MPPWNWKDYDDVKEELIILKSKAEECSPNTPKQVLKAKDNIDRLFEHSDQEEDDMERDRDLSGQLEKAVDEFGRICHCLK